MRVPKRVNVIGTVETVAWLPTKAKWPTDKSFWRCRQLIAVNASHTILFLFPEKTTGVENTFFDQGGQAAGHAHREIEYDIPSRTLKKIGAPRRIIYRTDWWEGYEKHYNHDFDSGSVYANRQRDPDVFAIKLPRGRIITKDGI